MLLPARHIHPLFSNLRGISCWQLLQVGSQSARVQHRFVPFSVVGLTHEDAVPQGQVLNPRFLHEGQATMLLSYSVYTAMCLRCTYTMLLYRYLHNYIV